MGIISKLIQQSIAYLRNHPENIRLIEEWINKGDRANELVFLGDTGLPHVDRPYKLLRERICKFIEQANIITSEEIVLYRETDFPNREISLCVPTTNRSEGPGSFGSINYQIIIPKGTKLFYISAIDLVRGFSNDQTEEEFLIAPHKTKLVDGKICLYN